MELVRTQIQRQPKTIQATTVMEIAMSLTQKQMLMQMLILKQMLMLLTESLTLRLTERLTLRHMQASTNVQHAHAEEDADPHAIDASEVAAEGDTVETDVKPITCTDQQDLVENFQKTWSEEMEKEYLNREQSNSLLQQDRCEDEKTLAENHASEWFGSICNAVRAAAKTTLPRKKPTTYVQRKVSAHTKGLYLQKRQLQRNSRAVKKDFQDIQRRMKASCLEDYRTWVEKTVEDMDRADAAGEIKKIYKLVNIITGKPLKPPRNLTTDASGKLLQTPEEVASTWK